MSETTAIVIIVIIAVIVVGAFVINSFADTDEDRLRAIKRQSEEKMNALKAEHEAAREEREKAAKEREEELEKIASGEIVLEDDYFAKGFLETFEECLLEETSIPGGYPINLSMGTEVGFLACFQVINMLADVDAESDTTGIEFLKKFDSLDYKPMYPFWSEEERSLVESIYVKYGVLARNAIVEIGDSAAEKYATESILLCMEDRAAGKSFEKVTIEILRSKPSLTDSQQAILDIIELD